jgi:hypothetical protein
MRRQNLRKKRKTNFILIILHNSYLPSFGFGSLEKRMLISKRLFPSFLRHVCLEDMTNDVCFTQDFQVCNSMDHFNPGSLMSAILLLLFGGSSSKANSSSVGMLLHFWWYFSYVLIYFSYWFNLGFSVVVFLTIFLFCLDNFFFNVAQFCAKVFRLWRLPPFAVLRVAS